MLFGPLRMFHSRLGDFKTALHYARRGAAVSRSVSDPAALALAHSMLGMSLYLTGDLSGGRVELEAALLHGPGSQQGATTHLGFDGYNMAGATLAKILWLQGYPAQAAERARQTVKDAARLDHPVTLSVALVWAIFVFLETGDLPSAEEHVDRFIANAQSHSLGPYLAVGRGFKGQLAVRRGAAEDGVKDLQDCLEQLHAIRYELLTTPFDIALARGTRGNRRVHRRHDAGRRKHQAGRGKRRPLLPARIAACEGSTSSFSSAGRRWRRRDVS